MVALTSYEQSNGFSAVTADELYLINGGSFSWSGLGGAAAAGAVTGAMTGAIDGAAGGTVVVPVIGTVAGAVGVGAVGAVSGALIGAAGYLVESMISKD